MSAFRRGSNKKREFEQELEQEATSQATVADAKQQMQNWLIHLSFRGRGRCSRSLLFQKSVFSRSLCNLLVVCFLLHTTVYERIGSNFKGKNCLVFVVFQHVLLGSRSKAIQSTCKNTKAHDLQRLGLVPGGFVFVSDPWPKTFYFGPLSHRGTWHPALAIYVLLFNRYAPKFWFLTETFHFCTVHVVWGAWRFVVCPNGPARATTPIPTAILDAMFRRSFFFAIRVRVMRFTIWLGVWLGRWLAG